MKSVWFAFGTSLVLVACGAETSVPSDASDPVQDETAVSQMAADIENNPDVETAANTSTSDEDEVSALDQLARDICLAGDEGFSDLLTVPQGFASRGADARVHLGWALEGDQGEVVVSTPQLTQEQRMEFDFAIADFIRHNLVAGFDRTSLTGAYRSRDGRFCVVQTDPELIATLSAAAQALPEN